MSFPQLTPPPKIGQGQIDDWLYKLFTKARIILGSTSSTVGAAGAASALPATPTGYIEVNIDGTVYKVPYYAS